MKLIDFVKKEPKRAAWALLLISVSFITVFSALVAFGGISVYSRARARRTNAALVASDILSLYEAHAAQDNERVLVLRTQIELRSRECLSRGARESLFAILTADASRLSFLCEKIKDATSQNGVTDKVLGEAIRDTERETAGVLARAGETVTYSENTVPVYIPPAFGKTPLLLAEKYFQTPRIFRATADGVYCDNLYVRFDLSARQMIAYAMDCTPSAAAFAEAACVEKALSYLQNKCGIKDAAAIGVGCRDGICWVTAQTETSETAKIGIRMDTGAVCFFMLLQDK